MAVFLLNVCKFNECGIQFPNLTDLIHHIEATHIGEQRIRGSLVAWKRANRQNIESKYSDTMHRRISVCGCERDGTSSFYNQNLEPLPCGSVRLWYGMLLLPLQEQCITSHSRPRAHIQFNPYLYFRSSTAPRRSRPFKQTHTNHLFRITGQAVAAADPLNANQVGHPQQRCSRGR